MRKLSIKLIDSSNGNILDSLVVDHCQITQRATVFFWHEPIGIEHWFSEIDHWYIAHGMITIWYKSGVKLEICRISA